MSDDSVLIPMGPGYAFCAAFLGIPADTLAGLRSGELVAVPRWPTEAMVEAIRTAKKQGRLAEGIYAEALAAAPAPKGGADG